MTFKDKFWKQKHTPLSKRTFDALFKNIYIQQCKTRWQKVHELASSELKKPRGEEAKEPGQQ